MQKYLTKNENKRWDFFFFFAHLRWCLIGWALNILNAGIHYSKYRMPIHYDTIEVGQNKKSHLLLSFSVRIVWFFAFYQRNLFVKNITTSLPWRHLNNYTPYENECFNPRSQNHSVAFVTRVRCGVHAC